MKILKDISRFGNACRRVKIVHDYDITAGIDADGRAKPYFTWRVQGDYSLKVVRLAATVAIAAGALAIYKKTRSK